MTETIRPNNENECQVTSVQFWDTEQAIPLLTGLKLVPGTSEYIKFANKAKTLYTDEHNASGLPLYQPRYPSPTKVLHCSNCRVPLSSREEQIIHYGQDWHQFNVKRALEGLGSISEVAFMSELWNEEDDHSDEESFEDDDDDIDEDEILIRKQPRIFFLNSEAQVVSVYRSLLFHTKAEPSSEAELVQCVSMASRKWYWVILLIGGGHFAGAVFNGADPLAHKTVHSYTVRAKQGGTQSTHDKTAGSHPKSSGASMRRYNEQSHLQHIQELLELWSEHLTKCDLIFYRCPKNYKHILFGPSKAVLDRQDQRLRSIPFSTKKASYAEVKKVQRALGQVFVHGKVEELIESQKKEVKPKKPPKQPKSPGKQRKPPKLAMDEKAAIDTCQLGRGDTESESDKEDIALVMESVSFDMSILNPFGSSVEDEKIRKRNLRKMKGSRPVADKEVAENIVENQDKKYKAKILDNTVYTACRTGDLCRLKALHEFFRKRNPTVISNLLSNDAVSALVSMEPGCNFLTWTFGSQEKTLLHIAAENANRNTIWWLMEQGCDPSITNIKNEPPYIATKNKEVRNHFRRFMAAFPDKYDYNKAKIPGPLTKEIESRAKKLMNDKKRTQKKAKQEKEEERRQKELKIKEEEEEKRCFLLLSDREKRALAAEKRMKIAQNEATKGGGCHSRCFQCAKDITEIVPFEYLDFKFCSTHCVKEHRLKSKLDS